MPHPFSRLFAYDAWANREALASLGDVGGRDRAMRFMAHVVGAEWLWMSRLAGDLRPVVVWPEMSAAECRPQCDELAQAWSAYLATASAASLDQHVSYTNSKGEPWKSRVEDILLHVVLHSSYHRGQVALVQRDAGAEPAYSDYIHCIRSGLVE